MAAGLTMIALCAIIIVIYNLRRITVYKVAIYLRLSKEDENKNDNESESIANQKAMLISYAQDKDWEIYKIYSDEDYSGSDITRPAFNEMLHDAEKQNFQILLCKSLSRFARDVALVETYINNKFLEWGIRFISPTDYADTDSKGSRKNIQINSLVNQWYLEDLSENIRSVLKHKKLQGKFLSAIPPYGYKKNPDDKYKLIKDENVKEIIETIFELALTEHSVMSIVNHLNNRGYVNPSTYFIEQNWAKQKRAPHTRWTTSTIKRILHNQVYMGDLVLNVAGKKTYKSTRSTKRPKNEWIIHENMHEAYISRSDFKKIEKQLASRANFYTAHNGNYPNHYKGLIYCGECGGVLSLDTRNRSRNDTTFYRCARAERGASMCKGVTISQKWLDEELLNEARYIIELVLNNKLTPNLYETEKNGTTIKSNIQALKSHLERFNNTLAASYMDKAEGIITQDEYKIIRANLLKSITDIKNQIANEEYKLSDIYQYHDESENLIDFIEKHKNLTKINREIISSFVKRITVNKRNSSKLFDYNVNIEMKI